MEIDLNDPDGGYSVAPRDPSRLLDQVTLSPRGGAAAALPGKTPLRPSSGKSPHAAAVKLDVGETIEFDVTFCPKKVSARGRIAIHGILTVFLGFTRIHCSRRRDCKDSVLYDSAHDILCLNRCMLGYRLIA